MKRPRSLISRNPKARDSKRSSVGQTVGHARFGLALALGWILATGCPAFAVSATSVALTLTADGHPVSSVPQGTVVTLTATVTSGSIPVKPGQVNFCDVATAHCTDIHLLTTAELTKSGTTTYKFRPGPGIHGYKAIFLGTTSYAGNSSAALPLSVMTPAKLLPLTAIAASGSNGNYTVTGTVGGNGGTAPTGTVSFLDTGNGNAVLGTATLGVGTGFGFVNSSNSAVGDGTIAAGDFNGDGIPDLVVGTPSTKSQISPTGLTVLLGDGDGTFTTTGANLPTGMDPYSIAVSDFNADGNLDLAVVNAGNNKVTVLLDNGDGTFTPTTASPATDNDPVSIAVGDFNRDGIPDLAVANSVSSTVRVYLGNGDGAFTSVDVSLPTGANPDSIVTGDFNGDGILDLATANVTGNSVTALLGNGDGTFTPATAIPLGNTAPDTLVVADFNGDGILDLATANLGRNGSDGNTVTVLLGDGDGTFTLTTSRPATGVNPDSIVVGDFNGDGIPDLAIANGIDNTVTVLLGKGDGGFTSATASPATDTNPRGLAVGDFNGDGLSDLAVGNDGSYNGTSVYSGYGITALLSSTQIATATAAEISFEGTRHVAASYPGDSNYGPSTSAPTALAGPTEATTLLLNVSPSGTLSYGESVTFTATLSPTAYQSHSTDGETITFYSGNTSLGTGILSGGIATFTIHANSSTEVSANYGGDDYLSPSTSNVQSLAVAPRAATTLSLGVSPTYTPLSGQSVTLTATLSPSTYQGHNTDGEAVTFYDGNTSLGTGALSGGTATLSSEIFSSMTVSAQYDGDNYLTPSTSNIASIGLAPPLATTLTLSVNPLTSTYGEGETFTAHLTPSFFDGIAAGGTVTFTSQGRYLEEAGLGSGAATTTIYNLAPGTYSVQAGYAGNADFNTATSPTVTMVVNRATPTVSLTSSANPAPVSSPVTFAAFASPWDGRPGEQGSMYFYDGKTQLGGGPVNMSSGELEITTSSLSPGTHTITAVYSGDTDYTQATSSPLTETIGENEQGFTFGPAGGGTTPPSQTASPGEQAVYSFAVNPPSGATTSAPIAFSVTGLPSGATASFSPATVPANSGATNVTMTVTLAKRATASRLPRKPFGREPLPLLGLILLPFAGWPLRRSRCMKRMCCVLALCLAGAASMASLVGCGSGGGMNGANNGSGGSGSPPAPQPQTYTLTVTATSGQTSQSMTVDLTVD